MSDALIDRIRHICVKAGVSPGVMGEICHEVRHSEEERGALLDGLRAELKTFRDGFAREFAENCQLHHDLEEMRLRAIKAERPGYMGDVNGPGCDPDVP